MTKRDRVWEYVQLGVIAAMFVAVAIRWPNVPDRIPVHWNAAGEVDGYGGKFVGLLMLPLITLGLYLLLRYIPRIDPARANYASFGGAYLMVRVVLVVYMAFIFVLINVAITDQSAVPMDRLVVGAVAVLFLVLGGVMGKLRPNWFVGIRTPWTLSSKLSWVKTHRVGGWVFIGSGVVTLVAALFGGEVAFYAMFAVLIPGMVFLVVYSYLVWRDDPDKVPAQETTPAEDS